MASNDLPRELVCRPQTVFLEQASQRRILHCSDIHVGRRFDPEPAEKLVEFARNLRPDAIVVTGDLTMRARRSQFRRVRAMLQRLPHPLIVIPGNHDIPLYNLPMRLFAPFRNYARYIADLDDGTLDLGVCAVWAVNTVCPYMHQKGWFREEDMRALEIWSQSLAPDTWRIVVVHQHFANTPDNPRPGIYFRAAYCLRRLAQAGVHLVLHGHVHQSGVFLGREFFPQLEEPIVVAAAGTVSSGRTRGNDRIYQFNLLTCSRNTLEIEVWNWNTQSRTFEAGPKRLFEKEMFMKRGSSWRS
ncbi:MAG: metallophosphoesterase [Candidatus Sumerlaeaceae bacterium]|nr:metallophosphoesterase [Candidatus Sumerlaeaceae bacterium]